MLDFREFKKAASKSALRARRKVHELLPKHVAAAYKEAEKIAVQRANAEALHTYLGDILLQIADLAKSSKAGPSLSVKTIGELGGERFGLVIEPADSPNSVPHNSVLSLGIDNVPFSEDGEEPYQTLAITMRHVERSRSQYRGLFYIKRGHRTLSGPDQKLLCEAVGARIAAMLAQSQK